MRLWHIGNTTVRSPFRLRDGLIALSKSHLLGRVVGRERENEFARLLHEKGIVNILRDDADASDLGRKWRAALCQLGFLFPSFEVPDDFKASYSYEPLTITPNGMRLINSESVPAMQECFLRSLAAYYVPSMLEPQYDFQPFSPFRHALSVMVELEKTTGDNYLAFLEMALFVQSTNSADTIEEIARRIVEFRSKRDMAVNKKKHDRQALNLAAEEHGYVSSTFTDYADLNIRYIKASGLVHSKGRGLSIIPEKHLFVEQLIREETIPDTQIPSYCLVLGEGASLPTDNWETAKIVLGELINQARARGIYIDLSERSINNVGDISIVRYEIEQLLSEKSEEEFAVKQAQAWEEIAAYMELISSKRNSMMLASGELIKVPKGEAPAYFEWILWRAFLAIDSLINKPYEARRFIVDQDFIPIGTAPGNGPDIILEFDDFVLVVEVTLTESSRQEAAEGEPVRRHVADQVNIYGTLANKPVYGLFVANRVDSNTAETFRIGVWYTGDDQRLRLDIIPVTLSQFHSFFVALFKSGSIEPSIVRELLDRCRRTRQVQDAPKWKASIEREIAAMIRDLRQRSQPNVN